MYIRAFLHNTKDYLFDSILFFLFFYSMFKNLALMFAISFEFDQNTGVFFFYDKLLFIKW